MLHDYLALIACRYLWYFMKWPAEAGKISANELSSASEKTRNRYLLCDRYKLERVAYEKSRALKKKK